MFKSGRVKEMEGDSKASYSILNCGTCFLISAAISSGVKLMALRLYTRCVRLPSGASRNSTIARTCTTKRWW